MKLFVLDQALIFETLKQSSCQAQITNSGKVLETSMTPPTRPPDLRVPQTPKPKQIAGEKTLLYKKYPDG